MRFIVILIGMLFMHIAQAADFSIQSQAFANGDTIPGMFTCDGKDISPSLQWVNIPKNTQSFALIVSDPDAPGGTFYHWVVYNIPAITEGFAENVKRFSAGVIEATNSFGNAHYNGPCPPKGKAHHYIFTLYALDSKLDVTKADATSVLGALENHVIQKTQMVGLYQK